MKKNIILVCVSVCFMLVLAESGFRFLAKNANYTVENNRYKETIYHTYTEKELDWSLDKYDHKMGKACLSPSESAGIPYHPYFGYQAKMLDRACAQQFLKETEKSIVFLGGSVMDNTGAPNFLTTIDQYIHNTIPELHSLNLAESGVRSTNEMIRLLLEVIDLHPKAVVFLDGMNEFLAPMYGGRPEEDYYWTVAIKNRIAQNPLTRLFESLIYRSYLLRMIFSQTELVSPVFRDQKSPLHEDVIRTATVYIENVRKIHAICGIYNIQCLFFLQPLLYHKDTKTPEEKDILRYWQSMFPDQSTMYEIGYTHLFFNINIFLKTIEWIR